MSRALLGVHCKEILEPHAAREGVEKVMPVIPQSEVLANYLQEVGEKCGENLPKFFAGFHLSIFKGKWPQEISREVLDIFHSAPNKVLALLQLCQALCFAESSRKGSSSVFRWLEEGLLELVTRKRGYN